MDEDFTGRRTREPTVFVEILSPSSVGTDFTEKLVEYTGIATLQAYFIVSQDEPIVWVWNRSPASKTFPQTPVEFRGLDSQLNVAGLDVTLPLSDIYKGLKFS